MSLKDAIAGDAIRGIEWLQDRVDGFPAWESLPGELIDQIHDAFTKGTCACAIGHPKKLPTCQAWHQVAAQKASGLDSDSFRRKAVLGTPGAILAYSLDSGMLGHVLRQYDFAGRRLVFTYVAVWHCRNHPYKLLDSRWIKQHKVRDIVDTLQEPTPVTAWIWNCANDDLRAAITTGDDDVSRGALVHLFTSVFRSRDQRAQLAAQLVQQGRNTYELDRVDGTWEHNERLEDAATHILLELFPDAIRFPAYRARKRLGRGLYIGRCTVHECPSEFWPEHDKLYRSPLWFFADALVKGDFTRCRNRGCDNYFDRTFQACPLCKEPSSGKSSTLYLHRGFSTKEPPSETPAFEPPARLGLSRAIAQNEWFVEMLEAIHKDLCCFLIRKGVTPCMLDSLSAFVNAGDDLVQRWKELLTRPELLITWLHANPQRVPEGCTLRDMEIQWTRQHSLIRDRVTENLQLSQLEQGVLPARPKSTQHIDVAERDPQ